MRKPSPGHAEPMQPDQAISAAPSPLGSNHPGSQVPPRFPHFRGQLDVSRDPKTVVGTGMNVPSSRFAISLESQFPSLATSTDTVHPPTSGSTLTAVGRAARHVACNERLPSPSSPLVMSTAWDRGFLVTTASADLG